MLLKKTVVLVGMMGAGKTAVGRAVAAELAVPFLDSDEEIVSAANMSIAEIFDRDGEDFFRQAETRVIQRLLGGAPAVLSTGGGAFLRAENRDMISASGVSVCIAAPLDLLWSRVRHKDTRPLLRTDDPRATLEAIYAARQPVYGQADVVVQTRAEYSIADTCQEVIKAVSARADVLDLERG